MGSLDAAPARELSPGVHSRRAREHCLQPGSTGARLADGTTGATRTARRLLTLVAVGCPTYDEATVKLLEGSMRRTTLLALLFAALVAVLPISAEASGAPAAARYIVVLKNAVDSRAVANLHS